MKARIGGIISQMHSFDFAFGTILGELILRHSDNLSRTIQAKSTSASEAQQIAKLVITTMQQIRQDKQYDLFWEKTLKVYRYNGYFTSTFATKKKETSKIGRWKYQWSLSWVRKGFLSATIL